MIDRKALNEGEVLVTPDPKTEPFGFFVDTRSHHFMADEPEKVGGQGVGPLPMEILAASLASCTAITLRFYAQHKGLILPPFQVKVTHKHVVKAQTQESVLQLGVTLHLEGDVSKELEEKLLEIAGKCPVHRALLGTINITTQAAVSRGN